MENESPYGTFVMLFIITMATATVLLLIAKRKRKDPWAWFFSACVPWFGIIIASIICLILVANFGGITAILLILTGIFTFLDASKVGISQKENMKPFVKLLPMAWGIAMEFLIIIAYPLYLIKRNKLKTRSGKNIFWISTIICGGVTLLSLALRIIGRIASSG